MIIKKEQSQKKVVGKNMTVWEYPLKNPRLGIAVALINGRYPAEGESCNTECDEIYFVLSGKATVCIEKESYIVAEGDALMIERGKYYCVNAENLKILAPTAPAWFLKQQRNKVKKIK